jgi:hypothetical protein
LSSNKKWIVLLTWSGESSINLDHNKDGGKLSIEVTKYVVGGWFVIKLGGVVLFVAEKNEGRRRNGRERERSFFIS